jgi:flagellar assembly protein FliH
MGLIKSANAPAGLSPFSMKDIEKQAQVMLLRARGQVQELLAEANVQAEELKTSARAQGFTQGRGEGLIKGREQGMEEGKGSALAQYRQRLDGVLKTLTCVLEQIEGSRREIEGAAIREVIELAIAIARRVAKRQGEIDPEVLVENLKEAMRLVVHAADVRIAVNPRQKEMLMSMLGELRMHWPQLQHVELVEDGGLSCGSCRIMTGSGEVDGDLDGQLDRIVRDLLPDGGEGNEKK